MKVIKKSEQSLHGNCILFATNKLCHKQFLLMKNIFLNMFLCSSSSNCDDFVRILIGRCVVLERTIRLIGLDLI